MKLVTNRPVAQGDILIIPIASIPKTAKAAQADGHHYVIAHSETGHHHVIENSSAAQLVIDKTNALFGVLTVTEACELRHLRDFDTHGPFMLERGLYEVRHKREFGPEGWRRDIE